MSYFKLKCILLVWCVGSFAAGLSFLFTFSYGLCEPNCIRNYSMFKSYYNTTIVKRLFSKYICGPKKGRFVELCVKHLSTFTTDAASQLDVLWHNCDTLGVNSAQVGVLKKTN